MSDIHARARVEAERWLEGRSGQNPVPPRVGKAWCEQAMIEAFVAGFEQADEEFADQRQIGQRQLDNATALMTETAELLRGYEAHHRSKIDKTLNHGSTDPAEEKAERNAVQAARLEAWLRGEEYFPTKPEDDPGQSVEILMPAGLGLRVRFRTSLSRIACIEIESRHPDAVYGITQRLPVNYPDWVGEIKDWSPVRSTGGPGIRISHSDALAIIDFAHVGLTKEIAETIEGIIQKRRDEIAADLAGERPADQVFVRPEGPDGTQERPPLDLIDFPMLPEGKPIPIAGNLKPITDGPMADPQVVEGLMEAAGLAEPPAPLARTVMIGQTITTADPRFDPREPVRINGFEFVPAPKESE